MCLCFNEAVPSLGSEDMLPHKIWTALCVYTCMHSSVVPLLFPDPGAS